MTDRKVQDFTNVGNAQDGDVLLGERVTGATVLITVDGVTRLANTSGTNTGDQTITLTGDVTGSGTGSFVATIANDAVTYAKMQNVSATDKLLGRSTSGAGDVEEITCTAAGRAFLDDASASDQRTTLGLAIGTNVQAWDADLDTLSTAFTTASSSSAASLKFAEDTDNGLNTVTLIGPASTADVTLTLPAATDTLVGKATTDILTNKSIDADTNIITNIENADIKSAAAIALNKLAATTESRALVSDGSGFISPATTTSTEIGYINGVTSAIQTQIDTKTAGAASSTDNAAARFDSTTGKIIQNSLLIIADTTGNISGFEQATASKNLVVGGNATAAGFIDLLEDTDNGSNKVTITAPQTISSDKTITLQDVTGTVYVTGGTDVAVADGGTGTSSAGITAFNNITGYTAAGATGTTSTNLVFSTSPALTTPTFESLPAVTVATDDKIVIQDTSNSSAVSTITTQVLRDLAPTNTGFFAYLGTNQTGIVSGVTTKALIDTEITDSQGWFDSATNHRFTPLIAGKYFFVAAGRFTTSDDAAVAAFGIHLNGSATAYAQTSFHASTISVFGGVVATIISMNGSTDYVEFFVTHVSSGGDKDLQGLQRATYFSGLLMEKS